MASTWEKERINKDGSITYILAWRDHAGKDTQKSFKKKGDRKKFRTELEHKFLHGEFLAIKNITFDELAAKWLAIKKAEVRPKTYVMYAGHFKNRLIPAFGGFQCRSIAPDHISEFSAKLATDVKEGKIAAETHRKYLNALKSAFDSAIEWGYVAKNPAAFAKASKKTKKDIEILTPNEVLKLLEAVDERYYALVATA